MSRFATIAGGPGRLFFLIFFCLVLAAAPVCAKTAGLVAIEIYQDRTGYSYEQITNFALNEKNEVSLCADPSSPIDKSAYHRLSKITLAPGMWFERNAKGVLMLTQGDAAPGCIVPANLKYDKGDSFNPAQLAEKVVLAGQVLAASDPPQSQIAPLATGVVVVLVAAPDQELAEFLRAARQADVRAWRGYVAKYPGGSHVALAKRNLAALYFEAAGADLNGYLASKRSESPDYAKLKEARQLTDLAKPLVSNNEQINALSQKIHAEVLAISGASASSLNLYLAAVAKQSAGYSNLLVAEKLADAALDIDPSSPEDIDAEKQAQLARSAFDKVLREAELQIADRHPDEALKKIAPVRPFAGEDAKIEEEIHAIVALYVEQAKKLEEAPDWPNAISSLENANALVPSPDTQAMLTQAKQAAQNAANKAAAASALRKSQEYVDSKDILQAFEVLDDLPPPAHALVAEQLAALKDQYVIEAQKAAKNLEKAHLPIAGLSDEQGIQEAYAYLKRCSELTNDQDIETRADLLADSLSQFYLRQGKMYAEKPDGSGVNIGWTYLSEALQFKSSATSSAVHDEMASIRAIHLLKSRLSMKVDFRDQTSRKEAVDFASQLSDAMATGLEASGMNVKVVRAQESAPVQPGFQIVGEVIRNEKGTSQETIPKQSYYHSGEQAMPNPEWNKIDDALEKAKNNLDSARSALEGATSRGKKKEIDQAQNTVQEDQQKVDDLRKQLNTIAQTIAQPLESPYTYSLVIYHLKIIVELHFRIIDADGNATVPTVTVTKENPTTEYSVKNDVKPEDTRGVRKEGQIPNLDDLLEQTQNAARDELIKIATAKVAELPATILASADRKAQLGDNDGAGELYILYINSTPNVSTPERMRASRFLLTTFNFKDVRGTQVAD
ncbi:MAG TPA: hypothetical protein VL967_12735 [Terracidiphilus sp.]|nr:hypothetical protein [Terracidiphilus sp.]